MSRGKNMSKQRPLISVAFICLFLLTVSFTGCIDETDKSTEPIDSHIQLDTLSALPDWNDGDYHDYYKTIDVLHEFQIKYPDLVNLFSIGKSALGKDIWCIKITNEQNIERKYSCLIDGTIHGCEWEAGEACLYLAEYLLINFEGNETVTDILNTTEVYIAPLLNPDGRQIDDRFNENGIDLNRNFDVDFGRIRGHSIPLGKLFGRIKIPYLRFDRLHKWFPKVPLFVTNSGRRAFSEPETQAIRDIMMELDNYDFSFYVNCHTAVHTLSSPWHVFKPPFEMSNQEKKIHDDVIEWVVENTEYEDGDLSFEGYSYTASGTAADWCFKEFRIPSFTFEILSQDYEPGAGGGKHDNLVHWMKTTLPVFIYLLVNIENLHDWETPDIQPLLPEGVPPNPLG
jgi:Zinc carboxypeptidase